MHSPSLAVLIVLATLAQIRARPSTLQYAPTAYLAKFEDAGFSSASAVLPVNVYEDILYNGFSGIGSTTGFKVVGIIPQSPNNEIAYGLTNVPTTVQGTPEMTVVYQNTNATSFDLTSFFYGCSADVLLPLGCEITATCVNPDNQVVASDIFDFDGNGGVTQQMRHAEPKGFVGCQSVKFSTTGQVTGSTATIITVLHYSAGYY